MLRRFRFRVWCYWRAVRLFALIAWRESPAGGRISIRTAAEVARIVWLR